MFFLHYIAIRASKSMPDHRPESFVDNLLISQRETGRKTSKKSRKNKENPERKKRQYCSNIAINISVAQLHTGQGVNSSKHQPFRSDPTVCSICLNDCQDCPY